MKISYLVTCHNEGPELRRILTKLCAHLDNIWSGDEIVILDDFSTEPETVACIEEFSKKPYVRVFHHRLNNDFGAHKTYGSKQCQGNVICQLDADEYLADGLLINLHELLEANPQVELYRVPRVNIVRGMTDEDARKWGWHVTQLPEFPNLPIINWHTGDYQARIYKNDPKIYWHKPLHETIIGAEYVSALPKEVDYSIIHDKTIDRQRAQNEFYMKNWSVKANMGQA